MTIFVKYLQLTQECRFGYDKTSNYLENGGKITSFIGYVELT